MGVEAVPEEGGLYYPYGSGVPAILLCHGQDGNAHVHPVHVTQHESYEAQPNNGPAPFPPAGCAHYLQTYQTGWR